jgi:Ca-activated chloride channel homolog
MSFGTWPYLAVLTAVAVGLGLALAGRRRRQAVERVGQGLTRMSASHSAGRTRARALMLAMAATLCAIAVARPQRPGESTWRRRGIDVVVVMDFSASMLARDIHPHRLARMNKEVEELIDRLDSDRVGVVIFAGAAAHFPLTHDHEAARSVFRGLTVGDLPPGSDLGAALRMARCIVRPGLTDDPGCSGVGGRGRGGAPLPGRAALDDENLDDPGDADTRDEPPARLPDRARALVVFTDGEDTENRAGVEVQQAALLGIQVYFVGVGTARGELVPELDSQGQEIGWKKTPDGSFVTTRLAVDELEALARLAGGPDHLMIIGEPAATSEPIADAIRARLDGLEQGDLDERAVGRPRDIYHWFLFPAFLLLIIEACMSARRRGVLYPVVRPESGANGP